MENIRLLINRDETEFKFRVLGVFSGVNETELIDKIIGQCEMRNSVSVCKKVEERLEFIDADPEKHHWNDKMLGLKSSKELDFPKYINPQKLNLSIVGEIDLNDFYDK